ncbi:hypothetical protein G3I19_19070 [Streptomyces sp. SID10853]|uniref:(2Fe-2S)-binding protein n=1 Tax=Streptomyces sp. SID10853 TaxID=2706028 RepID=UPI0013BEE0D2|nr:hypothetical protein [Streptomyces sp. SID10853]
MYVCSCFGVTEKQVKDHADAGACTPREIASACKAGTDCGGCVRSIQALLGRGGCPRRELVEGRGQSARELVEGGRGQSAGEPVSGPGPVARPEPAAGRPVPAGSPLPEAA